MNYNSAIDRSKLVSAVEQEVVPWIPVGNDWDGDIYSIVPGAYGLRSDQLKPKTGGLELVSDNVLGVNTNVQTRNPVGRREANLSEESTQSNNSDDSDVGGFVFHQIGTLEYWGDEPENFQNMEDAARGPWLETGFCVVMRFTRSGGANGLYIIYDFYPEAQEVLADVSIGGMNILSGVTCLVEKGNSHSPRPPTRLRISGSATHLNQRRSSSIQSSLSGV